MKPIAKPTVTIGRVTLFFPEVVAVMGEEEEEKNNCDSGSGWGEQLELLQGSGTYHWLVLAKC